MAAARTYVLLSTIPTGNGPGKTPIKQCSAVMENHMQCWNAAAFSVKTLDEAGKPFEYQLCRRHALIEQSTAPSAVAEETKPTTKVLADSTSTFKPAPAKITEVQTVTEQKIEEDQNPTQAGNQTGSKLNEQPEQQDSQLSQSSKPLLQPNSKTTKPAAF